MSFRRGRWGMTLVFVAALVAAACSGTPTTDPLTTTAATTAVTIPGTAPLSSSSPTSPAEPSATDESTPTAPPETPPVTAPLPSYATGDDEFLFDENALHDFAIDLDESKLAVLDEDPAAEEYVEGSLTFNGETIERIGVRYKGSVGSFLGCTASGLGGADGFNPSGEKTCTQLSMKLKIDWDDKDREFYGVQRVLLHSTKRDASHLIERTAYWMFREMGVPAPRATNARVTVNGVFLGVFTLVEHPDARFTDEAFDDGEGNLYKEVWPFDGTGAPQSEERLLEALETNRKDDPTVEITRTFAEEFAAAAPEDRRAVMERWVDVDTMLRFLVVDRAISNEDGPLHWYCGDVTPRNNDDGEPTFAATDRVGCGPHNFFWYEDPTSRKVYLVPWDVDISLSNFMTSIVPIGDDLGAITDGCQPFYAGAIPLPQISAGCDPFVAELASMTQEYAAIRAELLAGPFSAEVIDAKIDTWAALIEDSVAEASELHDDVPTAEAWSAGVDALKAYIADQRSNGGDGR